MRKKLWSLFILAFALVFAACNDDDKMVFIGDELNGVYKGALDIELDGNTVAKDTPQKIYITKTGDNLIKLELKNFSFGALLIGDISVENIVVIKTGSDYSFIGTQDLTLVVGQCAVSVDGVINGDVIDIDIDIAVAGPPSMKVAVDFNGTKMAADQSSEAKITSFTFDSDNEKNAIVTSQPIIDGTTITFTVLDTATSEQIAALVPTITISDKATVTPASGVAADFNKIVTYTVKSEDGIYTSTYKVSIGAKVMKFSFDEWLDVESIITFEDVKPEDIFGSSNLGSVFLGLYAAETGYETVPNVLKSTDVVAGVASAKLVTLDTRILVTEDNKSLVPGITPGSLFIGEFDMAYLFTGGRLTCTRFGIKFDKKEPLSFKGNYKYRSGAEFVDASMIDENGDPQDIVVVPNKKDAGSIVAVLYEVNDYDDKGDVLTGVDINNSPKIVATALVGGVDAAFKPNGILDTSEWTAFDIQFTYLPGKSYDSAKKYKITFVCSSSIEGDTFKGAPGSTLSIDEFEIVFK